MSKKKKIIVAVAILLAIIVSFMGGQTFAKYVTEIRGQGNASIASWNFAVKDNQDKQIQTINLASTVNDETLVNNKIAPGTNGEFIIKIDGRGSDVGIRYNIEISNETTKPQNLVYTYNGKEYTNLSKLAEEASGEIPANVSENDKLKVIQVDWKWSYETGTSDAEKANNNQQDTKDSKLGNYTFDIIVTGTQVEPNA